MGTKDMEALVMILRSAKAFVRGAVMLAVMLMAACSTDETVPSFSRAPQPLPPLNRRQPTAVDSLRVLAVGNSYTEDATLYLDDMLKAASIDRGRVGIYAMTRPGYSLQQWRAAYESRETVSARPVAGNIEMLAEGTMKEIFAQPWDIIVFQQFSQLSADASSFIPYLTILSQHAVNDCANDGVCIAWHMTWNYWRQYKGFPPERIPYSKIVEAVKKMMADNRVDVVIPTATAIENARRTSLNTGHDLTRDGVHLAFGAGCYVAAATWFETLLMPAFERTLDSTVFTWEIKSWERASTKYEALAVTEDNFRLCQQCAIAAVRCPFAITQIEE